MAVVVAAYTLANVAYLVTLGPSGLAESTAPAAATMEAVSHHVELSHRDSMIFDDRAVVCVTYAT